MSKEFEVKVSVLADGTQVSEVVFKEEKQIKKEEKPLSSNKTA